MGLEMKFVTTLSLAWYLVAASHASAFEVNGFRTGMELDQVRKNAEKYGELHAIDKNTYLGSNPLGSYSTFTFCKAKLVSLQQDQPTSFKQLALLIAEFNKSYGQPFSIKAGPRPDPIGDAHEIRISWRARSEYASIYYKDSSQGASLSTSYQATNSCFKVPR